MKRLLTILILACLPTWATTLYVKSTGDNTDGTTLAKAFTTITKALSKTCGGGASNCSTGGDTIWVSPGTYNEIVTTGIDSPVSELAVKCDLTGGNTASSPGLCLVTAYTSGLTATPSTSAVFTFSKNYITLEGFYVLSGGSTSGGRSVVINAGVTNITIRKCHLSQAYHASLDINASGAATILIDRCIVDGKTAINLTKHATADYLSEIILRNSVFRYGVAQRDVASGGNAYLGGGVRMENCYSVGITSITNGYGMDNFIGSVTYPAVITSSVLRNVDYGYPLKGTSTIAEDFNFLQNAPTGIIWGANSKIGSYPAVYDLGASMLFSLQPNFSYAPLSQSPLIAYGSYSGQVRAPGTVATSNATGTVDWTNPNNVKIADAVYATVTLAQTAESYWLKCTNFGFNIPAGATIKAVVAQIRKMADVASSIKDIHVQLIDDTGTLTGLDQADRTNFYGTSNAFTNGYYGNSTTEANQMWTPGITLTPAIVNDADFGVAISVINDDAAAGDNTASIDVVRMVVYYTSDVTTDMLGTTRPSTLAPGPGEYKQFQRGGNIAHGN